jgi:hypothetical protein
MDVGGGGMIQSNIYLTLPLPMELSPTKTRPQSPLMELLKREIVEKTVSLKETVYKKTVLLHMSLISIYKLLFRREMTKMMKIKSVIGIIRVPSSGIGCGGVP